MCTPFFKNGVKNGVHTLLFFDKNGVHTLLFFDKNKVPHLALFDVKSENGVKNRKNCECCPGHY